MLLKIFTRYLILPEKFDRILRVTSCHYSKIGCHFLALISSSLLASCLLLKIGPSLVIKPVREKGADKIYYYLRVLQQREKSKWLHR